MVRAVASPQGERRLPNDLSMIIKTFQTEQSWIDATTNFIKSINPHTIALSGGSTPKPIYQNFPNGDYEFYQVDERYVPRDHPESNYRIIKESLGKPIHYFDTSIPIEQSLKTYASKLPKNFDLCILGIGEDGHTASLFPHCKALKTDASVAETNTENFTVHHRLTLTFPKILASKAILVLLKDKKKVLEELQDSKKTPQQYPALKLLQHQNLIIHALNPLYIPE